MAIGVSAGTDATPAPPPPAEAEAAPKAEPRRLWLHASLASSPGAFGFFRTAHAEPLGDSLRLLLDYDLPGAVPPITGVPQALTSAHSCCVTLCILQ